MNIKCCDFRTDKAGHSDELSNPTAAHKAYKFKNTSFIDKVIRKRYIIKRKHAHILKRTFLEPLYEPTV